MGVSFMMLPLTEFVFTVTPSDWLADSSIQWQVSQILHSSWFENTLVFAQNTSAIKSIDILADFQKAWSNFIKSGQVWALGIGLVLGWVLHGFIGS
jgi:hypothetical protein